MLLAAVLHASWHGLVKSGADQIVNIAGMGLVSAVAAIVTLPFVPAPPAVVWPVLLAAVVLHNGYKVFLARAYARGDLVQAFPLARGAVPLFSSLIALSVMGRVPSPGQIAGIAMVCAGILSITLETFRANGPLLTAALGAGMMVAGYSVLDAYGTRVYGDWLGFTAWLVLADTLTFFAYSRIARGRDLWPGLLRMRGRVISSGVLGIVSFTVFIWALSRNAVGPVSALRETSILFAMIIGAAVYNEPLTWRRLVGGLLIVSGDSDDRAVTHLGR